MMIELNLVELIKIESALREKIERVDNVVNECDEPDMAKELLTYQANLRSLYLKIESAVENYERYEGI